MKYNYDSNGAIFSYFMLTLVTLVLVPFTLNTVRGSKSNSLQITCSCHQCDIKRALIPTRKKKSFPFKWVFLLLGWLLFGYILHQAVTLKMDEEVLWDPYQILGVDIDADEKAVKKAFKKLSLIYHPDKVKEAEKEASAEKYIDISKAYKVLTDEEARALFDEFGHPDGKQAFELGLALPSWLVEQGNSGLVLLVYCAVVGIGLPVLVARWWTNAKVMSKNHILNETMGIFYRDLRDNMNAKALIEVLAKSHEFVKMAETFPTDPAVWGKYEKRLIKDNEKVALDLKSLKKSQNLTDTGRKVVLLITAHLNRIQPKNEHLLRLQADVVESCGVLVHGLLQISQSRNWIRVTISIMELSQIITQAIQPLQSEFYQLPYMSPEVLKHFNTKKRKIENISQLLELEPKTRRELLGSLEPRQIEILEEVASQYPRIELVKAEYSVYGEPVIVPSSLVTLTVKFRCLYGNEKPDPKADNSIPDSEVEKAMQRKWWIPAPEEKITPHMPYFPTIKKPSFTVILANMSIGRLICIQKVYGATQDHVCRLQFQSPPDVGSWTFQVFIKSDTYVGSDIKLDLKLVVSPASELPEENYDDTISEPEDSIIGYEKPVKKPKLAKEERGQWDDSSDSDDEYSEEEEMEGPGEDFIE